MAPAENALGWGISRCGGPNGSGSGRPERQRSFQEEVHLFDRNGIWPCAHGTVLADRQELNAEQQQKDVYETHRHRVFSVSYYMTANEVEAEQILTDTFVQVFSESGAPDGHAVDRALLCELAQRYPVLAETPAAVASGDQMGRKQVRRTDLEEAVATLPPRERLVFLLRDVEGYAPARIAGLLRCDETEIGRTLISARIRMRNALASR
jgi:RNA polymerase sigma-70 factor (ECF subfamily)